MSPSTYQWSQVRMDTRHGRTGYYNSVVAAEAIDGHTSIQPDTPAWTRQDFHNVAKTPGPNWNHPNPYHHRQTEPSKPTERGKSIK